MKRRFLKKQDAKTVYAQSSDIKSRTYLDYRRDMKKKAIAELEILPWLENTARAFYRDKVSVEKSGGDRFIWFLRAGGVTREPDYKLIFSNGDTENIEFQYAEDESLSFFDFKISKVTKKKGGKRLPIAHKKFLYVIKSIANWAFIEPEYIIENSRMGGVPAWGNRQAYRLPADKLLPLLSYNASLASVIEMINAKNFILNFQHKIIDREREKMSTILQSVIDDKKLVEIVPNSLYDFYEICFLLAHLNKEPVNIHLWLMYLLSYLLTARNSEDIFHIVYSMDFLWGHIPPGELYDNELPQIYNAVKTINNTLANYRTKRGSYESDKHIAPIEETRNSLFSINIIEDIMQELIIYYSVDIPPIKQIYQNIGDRDEIIATYSFINNEGK